MPWCSGTVQDWRSRGPQFKPWCGHKENLSQVQSQQPHHQFLCTRVKYLKLSEVKSISYCVALIECRTRDPEVPSCNPSVAKKKISHRSIQNNITTNPSAPELIPQIVKGENQNSMWCSGRVQDWRSRGPQFKPWCGQKENLSQGQSQQPHYQFLCTRVKYLKLSEVKSISCCGVLVECRTRDPEVPCSNPGVVKNKISHRSNQNNITTDPSAPELIPQIVRGEIQNLP